MATVKQYLVNFKQRGGKAVADVFKKIGGAAKKAIPSFKTLNKEIKVTKGAMLGVAAAAATLGIGMKKVIDLTARSSQIASMTKAFNDLSKGLDFNSQSLDKLNRALDGTVSQFDLLKQANNALVLGITDSDDVLAEMFDGAQRLARALGQDALFGVESFITGVGRQSVLMLDNLGILVKSDQAYQTYANTLGITVSELTAVQKKTAFTEAATTALRDSVEKLGKEVPTTSDNLATLGTNLENFSLTLVNNLSPALDGVLKTWNDFFSSDAIANPNIVAKGGDLITAYSEQILRLDEHIVQLRADAVRLNEDGQIVMDPAGMDRVNEALALRNQLEQSQQDLINNQDAPETDEEGIRRGEEENLIIIEKVKGLNHEATAHRKLGAVKLKNLQDEFKQAALSGQKADEAAKSIIRAETAEAISGLVSSILKGVPFPLNVALAAAAGATASSLMDSALGSAATGADFVTSGPQLLLVGENPGGREQVQVTPLSSPNIDGPQGGGAVSITINGDVLDGADFRDKVGEAINMIQQGIA